MAYTHILRWYQYSHKEKQSFHSYFNKADDNQQKKDFSSLHIFWWNYEAVCGVSTVKTKGVAHRHTPHVQLAGTYIPIYLLPTSFLGEQRTISKGPIYYPDRMHNFSFHSLRLPNYDNSSFVHKYVPTSHIWTTDLWLAVALK